MCTYLGLEVQGRLVRPQGLRSRLLGRCRRRRITSGNSGYFASLVDGRRSVNVEARSRNVERVRDVSSRARVFLYEPLHGGFRGFTNRVRGNGNRRLGPRGDANLRLGLHVRACECWACARYVYVRNDKRVCAQVSTKEEVWVPRGVVGW